MRIVVTGLIVASAVFAGSPARAADLAGAWAGAVHAEPFVVYDYEPGIVVRTYWLPPWGGRRYFPSGGKLPVLGRREQLTPAPISDKRSYRREWLSFPVDVIRQPPLILNQQQYFPSSEVAPPPVLK